MLNFLCWGLPKEASRHCSSWAPGALVHTTAKQGGQSLSSDFCSWLLNRKHFKGTCFAENTKCLLPDNQDFFKMSHMVIWDPHNPYLPSDVLAWPLKNAHNIQTPEYMESKISRNKERWKCSCPFLAEQCNRKQKKIRISQEIRGTCKSISRAKAASSRGQWGWEAYSSSLLFP